MANQILSVGLRILNFGRKAHIFVGKRSYISPRKLALNFSRKSLAIRVTMIKAKLCDAKKYASIHRDFAMCFETLAEILKNFKEGEIKRGDVRFLCQKYATKDAAEKKLEVHRKFIDIQFLVSGKEKVFFGDISDFAVKVPYNAEKDAEFLDGNLQDFTLLRPGEFAVFFPEDAHKPGCKAGESAGEVEKVVVKVPVI